MNNKKQKNEISTSSNAELMYDAFDEAYVFSSEGLVKMENGEILNEYHVKNTTLELSKTVPGYTWGRRLIPSICGSFLLLDNKILLPYSLICKVLYMSDKNAVF